MLVLVSFAIQIWFLHILSLWKWMKYGWFYRSKKKKKNTRRKFSPCSIQFCWLWWIEWWLNRTGNEENHKFSFFILFFDPSVFSDERRKNCETIYLFECKNVDKKNWHLFLAKKKINQSVCIDFSDRFANLADGIVDSGPFEIYETLLNIKH